MANSPNDQPRFSFSEWLQNYGSGVLNDRLSAELADVSRQAQLLDKSGKVTLVLNITPKAGGVVVTPDVKVACPESKQAGQFYYVAPTGLSRRDPAQPTLPTMEDTQP
jgi:hypothetical protein